MKIFAIRDSLDSAPKDLAYLLYYEIEKLFYIELPDQADPWETPLLLSTFAKRGECSINSYWSKVWVQQRIIPTDRQNISTILRDNGLKEYDEYTLLMLSMGRCAQDDYYLVPLEEGLLPATLRERFGRRIEDIVPLDPYALLVFFRDGCVRRCELSDYFAARKQFQILLTRPDLFPTAQIQTGGHGVKWDVHLTISDSQLYEMGTPVPLGLSDFRNYVIQRVVNSAEAAELLNCSRQNIDDLTRRGKLHPIKSSGKNTLYLKSEILKRNWQ